MRRRKKTHVRQRLESVAHIHCPLRQCMLTLNFALSIASP